MRAGRSIFVEAARVMRYRRALATMRAVALLLVGVGVTMGAATAILVEPFDGPLFCALFIGMLWGTFITALGTWGML